MMGAFVRILRDGKWQAIEFDQLTDGELTEFEGRHPDDGWKWAKFLAKWMRENIKEAA